MCIDPSRSYKGCYPLLFIFPPVLFRTAHTISCSTSKSWSRQTTSNWLLSSLPQLALVASSISLCFLKPLTYNEFFFFCLFFRHYDGQRPNQWVCEELYCPTRRHLQQDISNSGCIYVSHELVLFFFNRWLTLFIYFLFFFNEDSNWRMWTKESSMLVVLTWSLAK